MNLLDIVLLVSILVVVLFGAFKGLVKLALGSLALVTGVALGCWYGATVASWLTAWIASESLRRLTAFGLIFLGTLLAFGLLVWLVTKTLEAAQIRWVDRLIGAGLGFVIAILIAGAILVPLTAFLPQDSALVTGSTLSPYVLKISAFVKSMVPDELRKRYEEARAKTAKAGQGTLPGGGSVPLPPSLPEVIQAIEKAKPSSQGASDPNAAAAAPAAVKSAPKKS